ncbi:MAG TPA: AI-2E family transporter [Candidatus Limnocylindria bacterium]|nr:AI-2E family transporter [Candidatus Limnocylindria bacterium]
MTERPPIQRWWLTYVAVGSAAVVGVLVAGAYVGQALAPLRELLFVLLFGIVVAFLLSPIVQLLSRFLPRWLAILIAFLGSLLLAILAITLIATPVVRQARGLVERVPDIVREMQTAEAVRIGSFEIPGDVKQRIGMEFAARGGDLVEQSASLAMRLVTAVVDIVLVLVLALYILGAAPLIRRSIREVVPRPHRRHVERIEDELADVFGRYVRGQLLLGLVIGILNFMAFTILGLPYALLLAVLAGILELVPIVGPIVAGAVAATVALFQPEPFPLFIWVIVAATAIQQLENHLLVPRISGGAVGIHPLAALLAVAIGIQLFGIVGGLFAVPAAGLAAIYLRRWIEARNARDETVAAT